MDNKKGYVGVEDGANYLKKIYVGVHDVARRIVKGYVGVDGVARLCYLLATKVKYVTALSASFTEKIVPIGQAYRDFPIATNSNRVDFWFDPAATAKNDKKKKYVDYPWCAYADANPSVYASYGYSQDLLAKHWDTTGASQKLSLGSITENTICETEEEHTLQHAYCARKIKVVIATKSESADSGSPFAEVFNSKGVSQKSFMGTGDEKDATYYVYPGMTMKLYARWIQGFGSIGSDGSACSVVIDGTKVLGKGTYTYTIPNNVSQLTLSLFKDPHVDFSCSYRVTMSTTKI